MFYNNLPFCRLHIVSKQDDFFNFVLYVLHSISLQNNNFEFPKVVLSVNSFNKILNNLIHCLYSATFKTKMTGTFS